MKNKMEKPTIKQSLTWTAGDGTERTFQMVKTNKGVTLFYSGLAKDFQTNNNERRSKS